MFLMGPNTCVPLGHCVKKQGAISHSSTEAEIIALEATVRTDGLPALIFWEQVLEIFTPEEEQVKIAKNRRQKALVHREYAQTPAERFASDIDFVPCTLPISSGMAKPYILEDNEPVIKMMIKQRWPQLRYVGRKHRIDLDWLFERLSVDPGCFLRFIGTKDQLADIFTKGGFTVVQFKHLVRSCMLVDKSPRKQTFVKPMGKQSFDKATENKFVASLGTRPVSYTHLTLPTNREV